MTGVLPLPFPADRWLSVGLVPMRATTSGWSVIRSVGTSPTGAIRVADGLGSPPEADQRSAGASPTVAHTLRATVVVPDRSIRNCRTSGADLPKTNVAAVNVRR
jgi:hypothetical protein